MVLIPVVDEEDNIIDYKERDSLTDSDIYRISVLVVCDQEKRMLITRRALTKKKSPGRWSLAVSGTVEKGETYEDNIIKETKEEINIELLNFEEILYKRVNNESNYFAKVYITTLPHTTKFVFDPEEIMDYKRLSKDEIEKKMNDDPEYFTRAFRASWSIIKEHLN